MYAGDMKIGSIIYQETTARVFIAIPYPTGLFDRSHGIYAYGEPSFPDDIAKVIASIIRTVKRRAIIHKTFRICSVLVIGVVAVAVIRYCASLQ